MAGPQLVVAIASMNRFGSQRPPMPALGQPYDAFYGTDALAAPASESRAATIRSAVRHVIQAAKHFLDEAFPLRYPVHGRNNEGWNIDGWQSCAML